MNSLEPGMLGKLMTQYRDLWQMRLMGPDELARFCRDRGVRSWNRHVIKLWQLRLLRADLVLSSRKLRWRGAILVGEYHDGRHIYADDRRPRRRKRGWTNALEDLADYPPWIELLFHPFRYFVLYHLDRVLNLGISRIQVLLAERYPNVLERSLSEFNRWSASPDFLELVEFWNNVAALAIMAEPCTFEYVFRRHSRPAGIDEEAYRERVAEYDVRVAQIYAALDAEEIAKFRKDLCLAAELLDPNTSIHTMIRLGSAELRLRSKGRLGGAIHLKTMAEMIRRAVEKFTDVNLPEEDELGFGLMPPRAKVLTLGSPRLLDGDRALVRRFLRLFALDPSTRLRWYVEGETEYGALTAITGSYPVGIEVINLRARVIEKGSLAFRDSLRTDVENEVFSFVLLDADRPDNVRVVKKAAADDEICGQFYCPDPDFEFGNFTPDELEGMVWAIAEEGGALATTRRELHRAVENAVSGKELTDRAKTALPELAQLSRNQDWGRRLMEYAWQHPLFPDGTRRPIVEAVETALRVEFFDYRETRRLMRVDPDTGLLVERRPDNA